MTKSYKFLILNTDYPDFLQWVYDRQPGLEHKPYDFQMKVLNESLFGVADFYSRNLQKLGFKAWDIRFNNKYMQRKWALENGIKIKQPLKPNRIKLVFRNVRKLAAKTPVKYVKDIFNPVTRLIDNQQSLSYEILAAQIKHYKPDVLLNQAMDGISNRFLKEMKPYVRLLVGQHAANRLADNSDFGCYDLVISSFPPTIEHFRQQGIKAELNRLGFEPKVLSCLKDNEKIYDVTFIGGFYNIHSSRIKLLEALCNRFESLKIWSPSLDGLSLNSPLRKNYVGSAWGRDMYQLLYDSKITINHHGDIPPYANNCRLYEATGAGALLVTDYKANLNEIFEIGKEVVAYKTTEECIKMIQYYLEHPDEREAVASAGQRRTLSEHTYYQRMQELEAIIKRHLKN